MPPKRKAPAAPKRTSAPPAEVSYADWKAGAAAEAQRRGVPDGAVRERDWRNLFIRGETPEQAAEYAQRFHHNATVTTKGRR